MRHERNIFEVQLFDQPKKVRGMIRNSVATILRFVREPAAEMVNRDAPVVGS